MLEQTEEIETFDLKSIERGFDVKSTWRLGNPADKALRVRFFNKSVLLRRDTIAAKKPIYKSREYVEIGVDSKNTIRRPVSDEDKARFAEQYKLFKEKAQVDISGTPIDYVRALSVSARATCKSLGINTVKDLINTTKKHLLGDEADAWIEAAKKYDADDSADPAVLGMLKTENEESKKVVQLQSKQIADLQKLLAEAEKNKVKTETTKKAKNGKNSSTAPTGDS